MSKPTVSLPVKCARLEPAGALTRLLDLAGPLAAVAQLAQPTRHSVQRLLAAQLLLGRSFSAIARDLTRLLYFAVGWLAAPSRTLRVYGAVRRWHVALGGLAALVALRLAARKLLESFDDTARAKAAARRKLEQAGSFAAWSAAARELDALSGLSQQEQLARWRRETRLYDRRLLATRLRHLREVRERGDVEEMAFAVRADLLRNLANVTSPELHEFPVMPEPIREYINEVKQHLETLTHAEEGRQFTLEHKMNFLRETRHAFGRTALVLSGGGALGAFHVGVVKALFDQSLLPRVLAGSSVGSIVASTIATRNDEELTELFSREADIDLSFFSNNTASQFLSHFWSHGTLQDGKLLANRLKVLLGTSTFLQAFQHSGRVLNVAVCPADTNEPPRVLNYLTAPHVYVWSAVSCSSAFPLLFEPQELYARDHRGHTVKFSAEAMRESQRRWRDGSLEEDLPMRCLSEMFNVNYFLVSQTNPHIVPALNLKKRVPRKLGDLLESEWKHRCQQLMALIPSLRILKVFSQPWEGDVTMVLPSTYMQIKKSITNPTAEDLRTACRQGEQSTWAKLSAIQANCGIETTLDACMLAASKMAAERRATNARARGSRGRLNAPVKRAPPRCPSWVNMSAIGLPASASDDALDRSGPGSAGDLMVHARAGEEPIAPAPPNMLCRSSMALSTAPSEPLDAVAEADNEAAGDSSGSSGRSSPGAGASVSVSPFTASAFALEAMPPAESFRYPYGAEPEPPADQAGDCCDESVQVGIWGCLAQLARTSVREPTGVWAGARMHASPSGQGLDYVEC